LLLVPKMSTVQIEPLNETHFDGVSALLRTTFRLDEPMNRAIALTEDDCRQAFEDCTSFCIPDGVSFVAVDSATSNVVGCRLCTIRSRSTYGSEHEDFYAIYPPKMASILEFLDHLGGDIFDLLPQEYEKLLKLEILCVHEDYRRQHIAQKTVEMTLAVARQKGCQYVSSTATSFKTQEMFEKKLGFSTLKTIPLTGYRSSRGVEIYANMQSDNPVAKLMGKSLCL